MNISWVSFRPKVGLCFERSIMAHVSNTWVLCLTLKALLSSVSIVVLANVEVRRNTEMILGSTIYLQNATKWVALCKYESVSSGS